MVFLKPLDTGNLLPLCGCLDMSACTQHSQHFRAIMVEWRPRVDGKVHEEGHVAEAHRPVDQRLRWNGQLTTMQA